MKKISTLKQVGNSVQCFDQKGNYMFTKYGTLNSFTESTISMKSPDKRSQVFGTKNNYLFTR